MTASCVLIVLTRDEEVHIARCLESARGLAEQVFVVDSDSADRTREIAAACGAHVVSHPFQNQAHQFNWALETLPISAPWVLRLDADEYLLPQLRDEIAQALSIVPDSVSAFAMKRRLYFKGRWIRHGGYYPVWLTRLFRRGCARSEEREMDEHITVLHGQTARLHNDFVDDNRKGLDAFTLKHLAYAGREATLLQRRMYLGTPVTGLDRKAARRRVLKEQGYLRFPPFLRALLYFLYRYLLRLGFLDGVEGLIFHVLQGFWYRFYVDAKVWEGG